jgi:plastocyanin
MFASLTEGVHAMATQHVDVGPGMLFNPKTSTVSVGDTVEWDWQEDGHSVTSDTNVWPDTGLQPAGFTFSYTFTTPGTYPYYCTAHGGPGGLAMAGVITVNAAEKSAQRPKP